MTAVPTGESEGNDGPEKVRAGSIDSGHLLLVGAGPGLGLAVAHRFAAGGYRVTLVARSADRLVLQPDFVTCGERALDAERPPLDDHGL